MSTSSGSDQTRRSLARWLRAGDRRLVRPLALLATAVLLAALGLQIWGDRWGLDTAYHGVERSARAPYFRQVSETLAYDRDSTRPLFSPIFEIVWSGWLDVERQSLYWLEIESGGESSLWVDGERVVVSPGSVPAKRVGSWVKLRRGLRHLEIRSSRLPGQWRLHRTRWRSKREPASRLIPPRLLYAERPSRFDRALRQATSGLTFVERRLLAGGLLLAAILLVWGALRPHASSLERMRWGIVERAPPKLVAVAGLLLLGIVVHQVSLRVGGSPYGYDDIRYLEAAVKQEGVGWILNRYTHVHMLRPFLGPTGDELFAGAERFWAVMFSLTVVAMAVAAYSLGRRLGTVTFVASVLLLLGQPVYFERVGSAYADYTAGLFVTLGVAAFLVGRRAEGVRWRYAAAMALGLCTLWGFRSKEVGLVLLCLAPLLLFERGVAKWRPFVVKLGFWLAGLILAQATLMVLDGIYLDDFFFSLQLGSWADTGDFNLGGPPQVERGSEGWISVLVRGIPGRTSGDASGALLGLTVLVAASVATWRRRALEIRLLHLLPVVYIAMMMVVHIKANYIFLQRYLYPIMPIACVLAAGLLRDAGAGRLDWRRILAPRFFVPAALATCVVVIFVLPVVGQLPSAEKILPMEWLREVGWADATIFARRIATPVLLLGSLSALCLLHRDRELRVALVVLFAALAFAPYVHFSLFKIATRQSIQTSDSFLYPLRQFEEELRAERLPVTVAPNLMGLRMCGRAETCARIVRLYLGPRPVYETAGYHRPWGVALATKEVVEAWAEDRPEVARKAIWDPTGMVAFVPPTVGPEQPEPPQPGSADSQP